MSLKNSAFVAAVASALGLSVTAGANPICESLLNDRQVTKFGVAEVDATGRALVLVGITEIVAGEPEEKIRPVCDSAGDVKLFSSTAAALSAAKRAGVGDMAVSVVAFVKAGTVGDPVKALIAKHKAIKVEDGNAAKGTATIDAKVSAAEALGWDIAVGTPEADEYADLVQRAASVAEWKTYTAARLVTLTASLVAAGIDPVTYAASVAP